MNTSAPLCGRPRKQFRTIASGEEHFRSEARDDARFRAGTWGEKSFQWPSGIKEERDALGRVSVTVNRMPGFIRQVTNAARQAHLRIQVSPVDDHGDDVPREQAQGLVRHRVDERVDAERVPGPANASKY